MGQDNNNPAEAVEIRNEVTSLATSLIAARHGRQALNELLDAVTEDECPPGREMTDLAKATQIVEAWAYCRLHETMAECEMHTTMMTVLRPFIPDES